MYEIYDLDGPLLPQILMEDAYAVVTAFSLDLDNELKIVIDRTPHPYPAQCTQ